VKHLFLFLTALCISVPVVSAEPLNKAKQGVEVVTDKHGATIRINGQLFTRYLIDAGPKPYCWPVLSADGTEVTRAFPMKKIESEKHDHPHQRSWWFTHGDVNGIDFWAETEESGLIVHRAFLTARSGSRVGELTTRNDWMSRAGVKICEDIRTIRVHNIDESRLVDFDITVAATEGPVTFGDTKEGMMGFRVATSMDVNSEMGGRIVNSRGQTDLDAWGQAAEWVDYTGPVNRRSLGVAVFNHPSSFRFPTYWHVRTYGLFAANPFGLHHFKNNDALDGGHTIAKGSAITFRYRIYIHKGDTAEADVAKFYQEYASE